MPDRLELPGEPPVTVILRRSARAKRLSLRVSRLDGRVTLSMPRGVSQAAAVAFAREKAGWLRGHLAQRLEPALAVAGAAFPFEGREVALRAAEPGARRSVIYRDGALYVPRDEVRALPALRAYLRESARIRLTAASDRFAARLGRGYSQIALRDTRSRWGSCSSDGRLMYSWRLIMAPPAVLEYVAAHEVAHLAHMDHSRAFWRVVEDLFPDHAAQRGWLRTEGNALHRWRFELTG